MEIRYRERDGYLEFKKLDKGQAFRIVNEDSEDRGWSGLMIKVYDKNKGYCAFVVSDNLIQCVGDNEVCHVIAEDVYVVRETSGESSWPVDAE